MARNLLFHCCSSSVTIHFIAGAATAGGHHAFACLTCALESKEEYSRQTPKVVPVATSLLQAESRLACISGSCSFFTDNKFQLLFIYISACGICST